MNKLLPLLFCLVFVRFESVRGFGNSSVDVNPTRVTAVVGGGPTSWIYTTGDQALQVKGTIDQVVNKLQAGAKACQ